jgi:hypothetical protein
MTDERPGSSEVVAACFFAAAAAPVPTAVIAVAVMPFGGIVSARPAATPP